MIGRARLPVVVFGLTVHAGAPSWAEEPQTCSAAHAYCLQLCNASTLPPPSGWSCEVDRCFGLQECFTTGFYRIGTQYGHHQPSRSIYGPYDKK
jgi:hypothetical protein